MRNVQVGVQLKSGDFAPPNYSLAGATIQTVVTEANGFPDAPTTCVTDATGFCPTTTLYAGQSETVTQLTAPDGPGLLADPTPQQIPECPICGDPVTVVFNDPGVPPQAADDTATVAVGHSVTIPVTANDDTAGAPATIAVTTEPQHGTATVSGTDIVYTPTAPFIGVDTFSYTLTTANGTSTANVAVTVTSPPVATDDTATTKAGEPVTVDVLANDDAEGGGTMTVSAVGRPGHGTATISGAKVVYTPAAGFAGTDSFTYTVTTADGSDTATVTVTVLAPPVAVDDTAKTLSGKAVTVDVLANDNAEGGGTMTISAVGHPGHGTATISGSQVVYTPSADFAGTDSFTYTVTTANGSATATVTVTVTAPVQTASLSSTGVPAEQLLLGGTGMLGSGALLLLGGVRRRRRA